MDFTRHDDDHNSLLAELDPTTDLNLSVQDESCLYVWAVFSVRRGSGPKRAIHLEGAFNRERLDLLGKLREIYQDLVILHDTKERGVLTKLPNLLHEDIAVLVQDDVLSEIELF